VTRAAALRRLALDRLPLGVAVGTAASSVLFDLISHGADTAFLYVRGSQVLTGLALVAAVLPGAFAWLRGTDGTDADRPRWRRRAVAIDVGIVLLGASTLVRRTADFAHHEASEPLVTALTAAAALTLVVAELVALDPAEAA